MALIIIFGTGGHAKVAQAVATLQNQYVTINFHDTNRKGEKQFNGCPLITYDADHIDWDHKKFFGIGSNKVRKQLAEHHATSRYETLIHPSAIVHSTAKIGHGTLIGPGAIIQPYAEIGDHVIINTGATVDHDSIIKDYAHIAPGANLCGGITVGEGTLIGVGASVIPSIEIGNWATVGAGAAVTQNIPDNSTALGVPAKLTT